MADKTEKFVVYTDNKKDDDGNIKIFASKYVPTFAADRLCPVKDAEEWAAINELLFSSMDKANEKAETEKEDNGDKATSDAESVFVLSGFAKSVASDKNNKSSFILAEKGDFEGEDAFDVTVCGSDREVKTILKYAMLSATKYLKLDFEESYGELYDVLNQVMKEIHEENLKNSADSKDVCED